VLTYEFENGLYGQHYVWFVDTLGRRFSFSAYCDDPLAAAPPIDLSTPKGMEKYLARMARTGGSVGPKQFAALVAVSEQLGPPLPYKEVEHLSTLVAASRAVAPVRTQATGCRDAASIRIRAYWPEGPGASFDTLWESYCDEIKLQNQSPAAQELVQWVHDHAGVLKDGGPRETVLPWKAPDTKPPSMLQTTRKELNDYVYSERPRTTACYEKALKTNPKLRGTVYMTWTTDAQGAPHDIKVDSYSSKSMKASSVPDCLRTIIATWRFRNTCPNSVEGLHLDFPPP
jgi:hypothetical protein